MKILLYILLLVLSQTSSAQDLNYDQYTTDEGLPSNTIYERVKDSAGLLWMVSENGLVSYDGESFVRFSVPRLRDNDILY
ncbi:MAG: ligand-binding sensor domain-containing protein [Saprospiraceae bacterium]|jgi:ligand-binding sensor domain-containing protein